MKIFLLIQLLKIFGFCYNFNYARFFMDKVINKLSKTKDKYYIDKTNSLLLIVEMFYIDILYYVWTYVIFPLANKIVES